MFKRGTLILIALLAAVILIGCKGKKADEAMEGEKEMAENESAEMEGQENVTDGSGGEEIAEGVAEGENETEMKNESASQSETFDTYDEYVVQITDTGFKPKTITINAGDSIAWENVRVNGSVGVRKAYIVGVGGNCRRPKLESPYPPGIATNESWSYQFNEAGTCTYIDGVQTTHSGNVIINE